MGKFMNEKPMEYTSHHGTRFTCARCDFAAPVYVRNDTASDEAHTQPSTKWFSDVAEFIGYHATNIHPKLNGFRGYDCIDWRWK